MATPTYAELLQENQKLRARIAALEAENQELRWELEALRQELAPLQDRDTSPRPSLSLGAKQKSLSRRGGSQAMRAPHAPSRRRWTRSAS